MNSFLDSSDWTLYLEREHELLLFDCFNLLYGEYLKKESGFGLTKFLTFYKGNAGVWYRSKKELEEADIYFANLIKNNDSRIEQWLETEKEVHSIVFDDETPEELINKFKKALFYNTVIPFRLLSASNYVEDKELKLKLDKIRAGSLYLPFLIQLISKLSTITNLSPEQISFSLTKEILANKLISTEEIEKRKNGVYWYYENDKLELIYSENDLLRNTAICDEVNGNIAFEGKVKGKVKIVNTMEQIPKVEQGDILVSINTNPSLLEAMKKAAAIVTNEGGITCHAAIISRELKIPCIIGTKNATKVFKDGDLIEVDAIKGIVKKCSG